MPIAVTVKESVFELVRGLPDDTAADEMLLRLQIHFAESARGDVDEDLAQEEWEEAWADEINQRIADMESGKVQGIPGEEVFRKLREKLDAMRRMDQAV